VSDIYQPLGQLSQGDIFDVAPHVFLREKLSFVRNHEGNYVPADPPSDLRGDMVVRSESAKGILLTHDCSIDKTSTKYWQICPVVPISKLSRQEQGDVRKNRVYKFLHLPELGGVLPESFADFSLITSISPELFQKAKRLATLSDLGRKALYAQYIRWLTRWELTSITCPSCSTEFDTSLTLSVRPL